MSDLPACGCGPVAVVGVHRPGCPRRPAPPPLCQEQVPLDSGTPGAVLRCDLPAGHRSEEHYDRAQRALWIPTPTGPQLTVGGLIPSPRLRDDEPWPDHGA